MSTTASPSVAPQAGAPPLREDRAALWVAGGSFLVAMVAWYIGAISMGWGAAESDHAPDSIWMYVRRASMIGMVLVLPALGKTPSITEFGWRISGKWLAISIAVGLFCGWFNRGGYRPESAALIAGAALHTFAVELYFRGYWIKVMECYTARFWTPILISGALYGLYQLTVFGIMKRPVTHILPLMLMFTALGILFGWGQRKSGAFTAAFIMHFVGVLSFRSLLG